MKILRDPFQYLLMNREKEYHPSIKIAQEITDIVLKNSNFKLLKADTVLNSRKVYVVYYHQTKQNIRGHISVNCNMVTVRFGLGKRCLLKGIYSPTFVERLLSIIKVYDSTIQKITTQLEKMLAVDIGNLFPITITAFDPKSNSLESHLFQFLESWVPERELVSLYNEFINTNNKFDVLRKMVQKHFTIQSRSIYYYLRKYAEKAIDIIKKYDGFTPVIGIISYRDSINDFMRKVKNNEFVSFPLFKKFFTLAKTDFVKKMLASQLNELDRVSVVVNESFTSSYLLDFQCYPSKDEFDKIIVCFKDRLEYIQKDIASTINLLAYMNRDVRGKIRNKLQNEGIDSIKINRYELKDVVSSK